MKPSTSTNVIARRGTSALGIPDSLSHGGRGLLATPAGAVACELEPLGVDESGARYELRVTNGTASALTATASAIRADDRRPVAALALEIEPHAAIRTGFTLDAALAYERVAAEVRGEGVHLVVEAAPPRGGRTRNRWIVPAMGLGVAALLTGVMLVVLAAERPRVVDAALVASPGGELVARWATTGEGERTYDLRDASGAVVAHGILPAASGVLPLGHGEAATLHIAVANAFGSDARDAAYAHATAAPAIRIVATPPPRIGSLAVDPLRPGAPLTVHYAARARDLQLAIVDRDGRPWFSTTTPSGNGMIQVPAPPAGPREPYTLIARADGAEAGEETRVAIAPAVAPIASAAPSAGASPAAGAAAGSTGGAQAAGGRATSNTTVVDVGGGDNFTVRPDAVRPGQPFVVEIPFADGARVELDRDADGAQIAGADLRSGERSVALVAPPRGAYTIRVTLQRGQGNEILVHALHFAPR